MPAPERRTRSDLLATLVVAVAVLTTATTLWWTSDARRTTLITAADPERQVSVSERVPSSLAEAWRAPSPATPVPVVQGGTVVTAASAGRTGEVTGRDLISGAVRWSYRRDLPLCTVGAALNRVVAMYQRGETCSEVTTLNWADGHRGPQRTGPVAAPTRLVADGDLVAVSGQRYLEVWRTDLVRTLAYGRLPTPVQPGRQPRPDCTYGSLALGPGRLAVIERCPGERSARLTVQRSHPKESDQPEVDFSTLLPGEQAYVVAVSPDRVAVALPGPPRLLVIDAQGNAEAEHPLAVPDADLRNDPPGGPAMITKTPTGVYWFTGSVTVALDAGDLRPRWTRPGSLGSGSVLAGRLLLPTPGALAVLDVATGRQIATLPVDRGGYAGPVGSASSGEVILEQRGDTLVALR
ncbi:MAG: hypothetical protein ABR608_03290 [Pseudonocardiaceae bacterium]